MKKCPQCSRTFADETLSYCVDDGALLSASYDPDKTQRISYQPNTDSALGVLTPEHPHRKQAGQRINRGVLYLALATLAILSIAGLIMYFNKSNPEKVLIGTWAVSSFISTSEAAKKSDETNPHAVSSERSITGSVTYHMGGNFDQEIDYTIRVRVPRPEGEIEKHLKIYLRVAGVWQIHNDVLVITAGDSSVTPLDNETKKLLADMPQFKEMLRPVKGASTSYKLKQVSDSKILLEEQESGATMVLQRKS